jgi:hypothetical protein
MTRRPVGSREYKVMLKPERFGGTEDEARLAVDDFWQEVGQLLAELDIPTEGSFDEVKAHRRIRFLDTVEGGLQGRRYIFRERIDVETEERQVTLKYRHVDRYVAQDRDLDARHRDDGESKFEEDVKPPFVSVFSYSTTVSVDTDRDFAQVEKVVDLFPGLADELEDVDSSDELTVVSDFCARELVLVGGAVLLGKRDIEAECAMVIWHHDDDPGTPPVCVEFSFKYENEDEDYRGSVARDAHDVLQVLGTRLTGWVHPEPVTKSAFVYS